MKKWIVASLIWVLFLSCNSRKFAKVVINAHILTVEVADTDKKRRKGLMGRSFLEQDAGMLFVFETPQIVSFWMKNTSIPLSIAFINEDYEIIQIEDMLPYDVVNIHKSKTNVRYALEVNQGWFDKNNIKIGDKIKIIWQ